MSPDSISLGTLEDSFESDCFPRQSIFGNMNNFVGESLPNWKITTLHGYFCTFRMDEIRYLTI